MKKIKLSSKVWKIHLEFRYWNEDIRIEIPVWITHEDEKDEDDEPLAFISIDQGLISPAILKETLALYKVATNKQFLNDLDEALKQVISKYMELKRVRK